MAATPITKATVHQIAQHAMTRGVVRSVDNWSPQDGSGIRYTVTFANGRSAQGLGSRFAYDVIRAAMIGWECAIEAEDNRRAMQAPLGLRHRGRG